MMNMKKMLGLATLAISAAASSVAIAAPSSMVAFTPETINMVKAGDVEAGKAKAAGCAGCHGAEGVAGNPGWPSIAGQNANYTYKQLRDYKDMKRPDPMMMGMVMGLDDQAMADIAQYYASLPMPPAKPAAGDLPLGDLMHNRGAADRANPIPACKACHGSSGLGQIVAVPALAGQNAAYLKATMMKYKGGSRGNDVYSVMRNIVKAMSDEEISQAADYYAGMGE